MTDRATSWTAWRRISMCSLIVAGAVGGTISWAQPSMRAQRFVVVTERQILEPYEPARQAVRGEWIHMEILTDQSSVRVETRGDGIGRERFTVTLKIAGRPDLYVLNPTDRTYYVRKPSTVGSQTAPQPSSDVALTRTGTVENILGYPTERIDTATRAVVPSPSGETRPDWLPGEITMRYEEWCPVDLKLPQPMVDVLGTSAVAGLPARPGASFAVCPLPLRSRVGSSFMLGYELVTRVVSIQNESVSADVFAIPKGYKQVPAL